MQKIKKIVLFLDSVPSGGGVFTYCRALIKSLTSLPKEKYEVCVMYTNRNWEEYLYDPIKLIYVPSGHLSKSLLQMVIVFCTQPLFFTILRILHPIAKKLISQKADLYIFPYQETFWGYVTGVPSIISIHDLMHRYERRFPEVSKNGRYYHREKHFLNVCKHSKGILVDSEYGKKQVYESYGFPSSRIFSLPYTAPHNINECKPLSNFDGKYSLPKKFIFYPAQFWEHKNHINLVKAVHAIMQECLDIRLVLVGSKKNAYQSVIDLIKKLSMTDIVYTMGYVPDDDLPEFYRRARALVMPTFFGPTNIPPLEAFVLECPVAISDIYGMPEQVGDAALLFDPNSIDEIALAIKKLWIDDGLCRVLIEKGKQKAKNWSQDCFDQRVFDIVENVMAP